ncbi:caspase domain-containing protein [Mycena maculata]|uniref:Caspase domain-containing protein n=1 Tax=Mycena maculata TaxID=230809 RepID=A0AAD7NNS5_9AGAR|nr:caspase domain-containing protein [Mycena maculata]
MLFSLANCPVFYFRFCLTLPSLIENRIQDGGHGITFNEISDDNCARIGFPLTIGADVPADAERYRSHLETGTKRPPVSARMVRRSIQMVWSDYKLTARDQIHTIAMAEPHLSTQTHGDRVFALIIGIDKYAKILPLLSGAVNDAKEFMEYLMAPRMEDFTRPPPAQQGLGVPAANIQLLTNKDATRDNILKIVKSHLIDNARIPDRSGGTMIFYFAGHGSRVASESMETSRDGKIETICPVDEGTEVDSGHVHAIPDYVLARLLYSLAERKGNNVMAILDSCHSGGMGREADTEMVSRNASRESRFIPASLDRDLFKGDTVRCHSLWAPFTASFVLLAACSEDKQAYESHGCGHFTRGLIAALNKANFEDTTPFELIEGLKLAQEQKPVCIGANRHRLLFNPIEYPSIGLRRVLKPSDGFRSFTASIGAVEGVCAGTEFMIYDRQNNLLYTTVPRTVENHQTVFIFDNGTLEISEGLRAVVKHFNNPFMILDVYIPHLGAQFVLEFLGNNLENSRRCYRQQDSSDKAHIRLRSHGPDIIVDRLVLTTRLLQETMQKPSSLTNDTSVFQSEEKEEARFSWAGLDLPLTFNAIAHFHYHLRHHNGDVLLPGFALEMFRVQGKFPNTTSIGGNMIDGPEVRLLLEEGAQYGFKIRNTLTVDLFPYLFSFDPDTYKITCWYSPENKNDRGPLRATSSLAVGMGSEYPFKFVSGPHGDTSSVFLKLFVSTEYLDLTSIEQKISPVKLEFKGVGRLKAEQEHLPRRSQWNAVTVHITIRKTAPWQLAIAPGYVPHTAGGRIIRIRYHTPGQAERSPLEIRIKDPDQSNPQYPARPARTVHVQTSIEHLSQGFGCFYGQRDFRLFRWAWPNGLPPLAEFKFGGTGLGGLGLGLGYTSRPH